MSVGGVGESGLCFVAGSEVWFEWGWLCFFVEALEDLLGVGVAAAHDGRLNIILNDMTYYVNRLFEYLGV